MSEEIREPYNLNDSLVEMAKVLAQTDDHELILGFLKDLLTPNEISEVATRWELVQRINQGISQRKIARDLGLSLCKITRGSKILKDEESPFRKMIDLSPRSPETTE